MWLPSPPPPSRENSPDESLRPYLKHNKRFRGNPTPCQGPFPAPALERRKRQRRQERHAGEIIPPAPPCFCLPVSPVRQGGSTDAGRVVEKGRKVGKTGLRRPGSLAGAVRSADSVQVCPHGPTCGADSCPACAGQSYQRKGFPDILGRGDAKFWEKTTLERCKLFRHIEEPHAWRKGVGIYQACAAAFVFDDWLPADLVEGSAFQMWKSGKSARAAMLRGTRTETGTEQKEGKRSGKKTREKRFRTPKNAAGRTRKGSSRKLWGFGGDYLPRCLSCLFCLFCLSFHSARGAWVRRWSSWWAISGVRPWLRAMASRFSTASQSRR